MSWTYRHASPPYSGIGVLLISSNIDRLYQCERNVSENLEGTLQCLLICVCKRAGVYYVALVKRSFVVAIEKGHKTLSTNGLDTRLGGDMLGLSDSDDKQIGLCPVRMRKLVEHILFLVKFGIE